MKSLKQILESYDVLYHFTNGHNVVNILKYDKFICSGDDGHNPDKYQYYMSLTRVPYAGTGYPSTLVWPDVVRLVIDSAGLHNKYKIQPIDTMQGRCYGGVVEAEERLLTNKPEIKQFHKYIKRIDINTNTIEANDADDIIRYADRLGMTVEVYESDKQFNTAK